VTKRRFLFIIATSALFLGATAASAALRLRPASEVLRDSTNILALGKAAERVDQERVRFEVVHVYSDERIDGISDEAKEPSKTNTDNEPQSKQTTRQFVARVGIDADVKIGSTYLIGVTRFLKGRFPQPKYRLDPDGYRVVDIPVVGNALFAHSADLEFLLTLPADIKGWPPRKTLDPILRLLDDPAANGRVAVLELYFQPYFGMELKPKEIGKLKSIIEKDSVDVVVRDYLLQAVARFPDRKDPDWVADAARKVLSRSSLEVGPGSAVAPFLHTSLRILKERGVEKDHDLAARMLQTSNSGITQSALQTMEALDAQHALLEAKAALQIKNLPEQSRKYLSSFVRRVEQQLAQSGDS
jgi:hypothetical protein